MKPQTLNKDGTPRKKHRPGGGRPPANTLAWMIRSSADVHAHFRTLKRKGETLGQLLGRLIKNKKPD